MGSVRCPHAITPEWIAAARFEIGIGDRRVPARAQLAPWYDPKSERGLSEVTMTALHPIAAALEVQVSWFFEPGAPPCPEELGLVLRQGRRRKLDFHGSGVHEEILSPNLSGQLLLVESSIAPGASTGERDRERRCEEAGLVLSGTFELRIDGKTLRLQAGGTSS